MDQGWSEIGVIKTSINLTPESLRGVKVERSRCDSAIVEGPKSNLRDVGGVLVSTIDAGESTKKALAKNTS